MLLLVGFVLVAIPLMGGIVGMSDALRKMANEGQRAVNVTADITRLSRQLTENAEDLKWTAGQYFVLEDPALIERVRRAHEAFGASLAGLRRIPWSSQQLALLSRLETLEKGLFARLQEAPDTGVKPFEAFRLDFEGLMEVVIGVVDQATQVVNAQVLSMDRTAREIQRVLMWQVGGLILLSVVLAAVLSRVLSRPVFELAAAIRRLGRNDLETRPRVRGPRDMVYLGQQLDWLRSRLRELEEKKLFFFREVSHELKTPLTSLVEASALLNDDVVGPLGESHREIVSIMQSSSAELKHRIEGLLRYNEALNQPRTAPSLFRLRALLSEVGENFDLQRHTKRLRWVTEVPDVQLSSDPARLAIVLENLLANAVKFSPEAGTVAVRATQDQGWLYLQVSDDGPGVEEAEHEHLFQPFHKGARARESGLQSSGLGLAIAKRYMEELGGELKQVSPPGEGACFELALPVSKEVMPHDAAKA